jgi:hypothetical protein
MVYRRSQWKLAACLVSVVACAPGIKHQNDAFVPAPPVGASTLVVRNGYFGEVDVYALTGSTRTRIGSVRTGSTASFRLSRMLMMRPEIQFQLDPVGPIGPFTYHPLDLTPGNTIELSAAASLQMSSYAIVVNH